MDLKELGTIHNIYGIRAPYLETNDDYYKVTKELGMLYNSSTSYYVKAWNIGSPASERRNWWPFTLDY